MIGSYARIDSSGVNTREDAGKQGAPLKPAPPAWLWPVVVALVLRLVAAVAWEIHTGGSFAFGDSESYWCLARAIAFGEEYRYGNTRVFRMPGYPLVLAPLFWIFGADPPHLAGRVLGAVLGALAVLGVYCLGVGLFSRRVGELAAWVTAVYPGAIALSVVILSEALFCPLMILALAGTVSAAKILTEDSSTSPRLLRHWLGAGILHGLAILTRPSWLLFPLVIMLLMLTVTAFRVRSLLAAAALLAGVCLPLCPWWFRNWCVTGRFVPTTLQVGASLYDGLHPEATGASDLSVVSRRMAELSREFFGMRSGWPAVRDSHKSDEYKSDGHKSPSTRHSSADSGPPFTETYPADRVRATNEPKKWAFWGICRISDDEAKQEIELEIFLDQALRSEAISWAVASPGQVIWLAWKKFLRMWNVWPNEPSFRAWPIRLAVAITFLPVIAFGLFGIIQFVPRGWYFAIPALPALYLTAIHCVFVSSLRYREPAMLALIPLAVAGACVLAERIRDSWSEKAQGT